MTSKHSKEPLNWRKILPSKINWRLLGASLVLSFICYGLFLRPDYATDSYIVIEGDFSELMSVFLGSGRPFTALCYLICKGLKLPFGVCYFLSFLFAFLNMSLAIYITDEILKKVGLKHKFNRFVVAALMIASCSSLELFCYIEKGIMVFSVLASVIGAYLFLRYLDYRRPSVLFMSLGAVIVSAFSYQGGIGIFIVLATLILLCRREEFWQFVRDTALSVALYALPPILNMIFIKVIDLSVRVGGDFALGETLTEICKQSLAMFLQFNIIPALPAYVLLLSICLVPIFVHLRRREFKDCGRFVLSAAYLSVVSILAATAPAITQPASWVWLTARSTLSFGSIFGLLAALSAAEYKTKERALDLQLLLGLALLVLQICSMHRVILDHYISNNIDMRRAQEILSDIETIEAEKAQGIQEIAPVLDTKQPLYGYPGLYFLKDVNISAFTTSWSDVNIINYYSQRKFTRVNASDAEVDACATHTEEDYVFYSEGRAVLCLP